jgi:hypothetical protein
LACFAILPLAMQGQNTTISGNVTDTDGFALIGATVLEEGTSNGTISDIDGNYQIILSGSDARLTFNYLGYQSQTVVVGGQTVLNITLEQGVTAP